MNDLLRFLFILLLILRRVLRVTPTVPGVSVQQAFNRNLELQNYLIVVTGVLEANLQYEDSPHDVEDLEETEEEVEDVIAREHVYMLLSGVQGGPQHLAGEDEAPHGDPDYSEHPKHHLGHLVSLGILTQLSQLQERIGAIVDD